MIYDTEINRPASIIISDSVNCYGCSTDIAVVAVRKCIISSLVQIAAIQPYRYGRTNIISGVCLINDCTYRSIWNIVRICIIAVIGSCYLNRNLQGILPSGRFSVSVVEPAVFAISFVPLI